MLRHVFFFLGAGISYGATLALFRWQLLKKGSKFADVSRGGEMGICGAEEREEKMREEVGAGGERCENKGGEEEKIRPGSVNLGVWDNRRQPGWCLARPGGSNME